MRFFEKFETGDFFRRRCEKEKGRLEEAEAKKAEVKELETNVRSETETATKGLEREMAKEQAVTQFDWAEIIGDLTTKDRDVVTEGAMTVELLGNEEEEQEEECWSEYEWFDTRLFDNSQ